MRIKTIGPCFVVPDVPASSQFYIEHFGFRPVAQLSWFAALAHDVKDCELSFVQRGHESIAEGYRDQVVAGMLIGFVVEDAAAEEARLRVAGVPIVQPLRDDPFGQRHFYIADLDGVLIDIIELIPPSAEWLAEHGLPVEQGP